MIKIVGETKEQEQEKTNAITEETPFVFEDSKKRVGNVSMNYLRNSSMILNSNGQPLKTRPVQSWELIDDFQNSMTSHEINFTPDNIYIDRNSATKRMTRDERQTYDGKAAPIKYWVFNDLITRFVFNNHGDGENYGCVAVAFNSNGIQVSFGLHVTVCSNLCILGGKRLQTYGSDKMSYDQILGRVNEWFSSIDQNVKVEMDIMKKLQETTLWSSDMGAAAYEKMENEIIGKVYRDAVVQNYLDKTTNAPINQHNASKFSQKLISDGKDFVERGEFTAWDLYNVGTNIIRPGNLDTKNIMDNIYLWLKVLDQMYNMKIESLREEE